MLELKSIKKDYITGGEVTAALDGVSLVFRENEFVSVLGPSGGGKTTLLNIIGGLDRYTSGDLLVDGKPTRDFTDGEWDAYRNGTVGFVFQSYNLIPHLSVLANVEIALSLSGVSGRERRERALRALEDVGLGDQIKKRPSQLSGGQMQRVAIARALVNNPKILLADEPTGALDSRTSAQIMDIVKEISRDRLVIMVTHNSEIANAYSDRVINLIDGRVVSDTAPALSGETESGGRLITKKTSMSYTEALKSSFKNLLTKKGRTAIISFAGSIGIIGVALVLALSNGLSAYMSAMQSDTLSGFPITVNATAASVDVTRLQNRAALNAGTGGDDSLIYSHDPSASVRRHTNILTEEYFDYVAAIEDALPGAVNTVVYSRAVGINLFSNAGGSVVKFDTAGRQGGILGGGGYWQELPENSEFILSLYDLVGEGSRLPGNAGEVAIVVDEQNRINREFFEQLGFTQGVESYALEDFIGASFLKVIPNDAYYTATGDGFFTPASAAEYAELYASDAGLELVVTGVLRIKESAAAAVELLSPGLVYTTALTDYVQQLASDSEISRAQAESDTDLLLAAPFAGEDAKKARLRELGALTLPVGVSVYPRDYESKDRIIEYLEAYNTDRPEEERVIYSDMAEMVASVTSTLLGTVSLVLVGFASISLVVSTIMIGIITYVSVLERIKEIGILRSVGARKRDISRVFNAEALIIGCAAGLIGVGLAQLLTVPANALIKRAAGISGIADLPAAYSLLLIAGSMALTAAAGFLPSRIAAAKDPVEALRRD